MNRKQLGIAAALLAGSVVFGNTASASDPVLGAIVGAGAGALVGKAIGGRDGLIVGGALGAATGAVIASERDGRRVAYAPPPPAYYAPPPQPVFYGAPVVVAPRPVYVVRHDDDWGRGRGNGWHRGWDRHHHRHHHD